MAATQWASGSCNYRPTVALTKVLTSATLGVGAQDPGFFTTISSNSNGNPIIWALSRPPNTQAAPITLFALNPDGGTKKKPAIKQLFKATAGAWPLAADGLRFRQRVLQDCG
ncbi:MAG: hypothetical protein WBV69_01755 [Candidatus Sulfotelmatobacter sp.]